MYQKGSFLYFKNSLGYLINSFYKIKSLDNPWEVHITHVFREANRCADMLANIGSEGISGFELLETPPARPGETNCG
jgi:hypothetical protein